MKNIVRVNRIFAAMLCVLMTLSMLPTSVFAAKEMFSACNYIGIRNCAIPVAGEKPDHSVDANEPGKYEIKTVNWYKNSVSAANAVGATETFKENTVYIVEFEVWAKGAYYFTNTNGNTTVTADVSDRNTEYGEFDAQVMNVAGQSVSSYLTVRCTFPKTEGKNTATQDPNIITKVNLTGLDLPVHHLGADTSVTSSDYRVTTEVVWTNQDGSEFSGVFEYGKSYTAMIYLFINNKYEFVKDYNHPLATKDKPMTSTKVTLDGEELSVMPDYTRSQFMTVLVAFKTVKCEGTLTVDSLNINVITEPKAGGSVNYNVGFNTSGYQLADLNDDTYKDGVAWRVDGGIYLPTNTKSFDPGETYQIVIRLVPKPGFEFAADNNGNTKMTATINGKTADVKSTKTEALVTYTFPKTGNLQRAVAGFWITEPEVGKAPDYNATNNDDSMYFADYNNASTKNGVSWYNETDKKPVPTYNSVFEAGKIYTVRATFWPADGYEFKYTNGAIDCAGYVNGKVAEVSSRSKEEVTVSYTFPALKEAKHEHSPLKVAETKATCKAEGKQAHYFCPECGKFFEDSKCTKEITDINRWGVIAKTTHTGGKATCDNRAICSICGERYGELAAHNFSKTWDHKDASGHAHKCKECGALDTIIPHSGGTAKCGELAKCAECKAEYGEVMQHQWSKTPEYTDSKGHAYKCTVCGEHDTVQAHTGGTADCKNKAKCSVCGSEYGKTGDHKWGTAWNYTDGKGHAHTCTLCGEHDDVVKHTPGAAATETSPQTCTVCNYVIEPAKKHEHKLTKVAAVSADCTNTGMEAHYICDSCGKIFEDSKGNKEITNKDSLIVPAVGHKESKWKSDADVHWKECTVKGCDAITVAKEAHDFNKNGKCTVCGYKSEAKTNASDTTAAPVTTDIPQTTDKAPEQDTGVSQSPEETAKPDENTAPDTADVSQPGDDAGNNTAMLIAVIASGAIAAACIIIVIVVLAKKKK